MFLKYQLIYNVPKNFGATNAAGFTALLGGFRESGSLHYLAKMAHY